MKWKRVHIFMILIVWLSGCVSNRALHESMGHYYVYKFGLRENEKTKNWKNTHFNNDSIDVVFYPDYNRILFEIKNISHQPMSILWDSVRLNSEDYTSKIMLSGTPFAKAGQSLSPATIAPQQSYKDYLLPVELIYKDGKNENGWKVADIYPVFDNKSESESDKIMGQFNQNIMTLTMPIVFNGKMVRYHFTFFPVEIERVISPDKIPHPSTH